MEYLLEVRWDDPIADAVVRILSSVPEGMERTTGQVPGGQNRAFVVYRSDSREALESLTRTMSDLGAHVLVTATPAQA